MTDYTKYIPYFLRSLRHNVKPVGWVPPESSRRTSTRFLDVSRETSLKSALTDRNSSRRFAVNMAKAFNLQKGDFVQVLYGRDAGSRGVISKVSRETNQVIVNGCNVIRSYRPSDAEKQVQPFLPSVVMVEAPIHITNIVPLDPVTKRPTRIKRRYSMTGECVRISKVSGCAIPDAIPVSQSFGDKSLHQKHKLKTGYLRGAPIASRFIRSWSEDQSHFASLRRMADRT
jgi:large subunit ribosomal protein L24